MMKSNNICQQARITLVYALLTLGIFACTSENAHERAAKDTHTASAPVETGRTPGTYQYCFVTADDTAILGLQISNSGIQGKFLSQYFGQERTDGRIENAYFRNDTLMGDYRYVSDSGKGVREVIFLITHGTAREAYGTLVKGEDKQVYASHKALRFNGPVLSLDGCGNRVPTFRKESTAD